MCDSKEKDDLLWRTKARPKTPKEALVYLKNIGLYDYAEHYEPYSEFITEVTAACKHAVSVGVSVDKVMRVFGYGDVGDESGFYIRLYEPENSKSLVEWFSAIGAMPWTPLLKETKCFTSMSLLRFILSPNGSPPKTFDLEQYLANVLENSSATFEQLNRTTIVDASYGNQDPDDCGDEDSIAGTVCECLCDSRDTDDELLKFKWFKALIHTPLKMCPKSLDSDSRLSADAFQRLEPDTDYGSPADWVLYRKALEYTVCYPQMLRKSLTVVMKVVGVNPLSVPTVISDLIVSFVNEPSNVDCAQRRLAELGPRRKRRKKR